jgi:hypothetical protein
MSSNRARTIAMAYKHLKSTTDMLPGGSFSALRRRSAKKSLAGKPRGLSISSIVWPEARSIAFCLHCSVLRERTFLKAAIFVYARGFQRDRCRTKWLTRRERAKCATAHLAASNKVGGSEILENCIEKNFHVSAMTHKSGHSYVSPGPLDKPRARRGDVKSGAILR